jgi:hypothetical protein
MVKALICQYGPNQHMVACHISQVLECMAICTIIWLEGFALHHIGTHLIHTSGAM